MPLSELLAAARRTVEYRRAKHNARADRDLLAALVRARIESGRSQKDIADVLGLSQQSVSKFERYDNDPKLSTVRQYADAIGVLVCHTVDLDHGQLEVGALEAVAVQVPHKIKHAFVTRSAGTYASPAVKRARFAMAA